MAKIVICGDAAVIVSALKLEDIKTVEKYRPEELILKDEYDEPIFRLATAKCGCGSINAYGAEFASETRDDQKLATMTVIFKTDGDIKEYVADTIGLYVANLNKLEEKLPDVIREIASERQAIMNSITIAQ